MENLYHIARASDWNDAVKNGTYEVGSLHHSFLQDGFIHLCYNHQVNVIADQIYHGTSDLLLLKIDPAKLAAEVRAEMAINPPEMFPHLYGPLNTNAVIAVEPYVVLPNGKFPIVKS
jgi:uncharacterized protein (DUF952 family)